MRKSLVTLASNGRSLMHTIRNNCGYEFVKLCLRYTARDPRLRSYVWWWTSEQSLSNNCGELTGQQIKNIFKYTTFANAHLNRNYLLQKRNSQQRYSVDVNVDPKHHPLGIQQFFTAKELNFF